MPPGTNGGITSYGTLASLAGGSFIGVAFWIMHFIFSVDVNVGPHKRSTSQQYPMIFVGALCGAIGSIIDSLLGATLQATYYSKERKCIIKNMKNMKSRMICKGDVCELDDSIELVCGHDVLSNEGVNFLSTLLTMIISLVIAPAIFYYFDNDYFRSL